VRRFRWCLFSPVRAAMHATKHDVFHRSRDRKVARDRDGLALTPWGNGSLERDDVSLIDRPSG
jgi:hypothetical protein